MSGHDQDVAEHYSSGGLHDRILRVLHGSGVSPADMRSEHLKAIDEFHIGGAPATEHLLDPLGLTERHKVLDIGSGIGGAVRHMVSRYGAHVTGVDLTPDFVDTARKLTHALGIEADFVQGSAVDLPFAAEQFDVATLLHVGMNIPDKPGLFAEVSRVLKPGGTFAVYDVMRFGAHPDFPLPWATTQETSFLEPPDTYLAAAEAAGFTLQHREDRGEVAKEFFAQMQARMQESGPPVLGLPLLMGETAPRKVENMIRAVQADDIAPVEMVFRKSG